VGSIRHKAAKVETLQLGRKKEERMSIRTLGLAVGLAAGLSACASSGGSGRNEPVRALMSADVLMLVSFDANQDLSVSTAEVDAGIAREFARADSNSDGSLQPIEFQHWSNLVLGGAQLGPFRLDFDRNVDNTITREEFETEIRARARHYDSDESDAISRGEFIRLVGQARPPSPRTRVAPPMP
jgi:hypothetical protein